MWLQVQKTNSHFKPRQAPITPSTKTKWVEGELPPAPDAGAQQEIKDGGKDVNMYYARAPRGLAIHRDSGTAFRI